MAFQHCGDLKKGPERARYRLATSTLMRRREEYCARIIQTAWRLCVVDARQKRRADAEAAAADEARMVPRAGGDGSAALDSISELSAASSTQSTAEQRHDTDPPPPRYQPPTSTTV